MMQQPNLSYIDELAEGDTAFKVRFIEILKREFPSEVVIYTDHIDQGDTKNAAQVVHKLKHKFNILGMEEAYRYAVAFEDELLVGKDTMNAGFQSILKTISSYLNTI